MALYFKKSSTSEFNGHEKELMKSASADSPNFVANSAIELIMPVPSIRELFQTAAKKRVPAQACTVFPNQQPLAVLATV